jgi:hypothetical protein
MRRFFYLLLIGHIVSCKVEKNLPGVYSPKNSQRTRLILKENKTFEFALLDPANDTVIFTEENGSNFFTTGQWEYVRKKLVLKCDANKSTQTIDLVNDSITHFTNISSINFWNRFGDPVPIRYILLQPGRAKPHFGNSLFFFAQDFKPTDTLRFYFDGYPSFDFPGSIPSTIGNNMHKIVLHEPARISSLPILYFKAKKHSLVFENAKLTLKKR